MVTEWLTLVMGKQQKAAKRKASKKQMKQETTSGPQ